MAARSRQYGSEHEAAGSITARSRHCWEYLMRHWQSERAAVGGVGTTPIEVVAAPSLSAFTQPFMSPTTAQSINTAEGDLLPMMRSTSFPLAVNWGCTVAVRGWTGQILLNPGRISLNFPDNTC